MRALHRSTLGSILMLGALALSGCGSGGGGSEPAAQAPATLSEAEQALGTSLLSPTEGLTSVLTLDASELPPETSAGASSVDGIDLPPSI